LPGRVAGTAAITLIHLPALCHPAFDEGLILPAAFDDHPGDGVVQESIRTRNYRQPQAAALLRPGHTHAAMRRGEDQSLVRRPAPHDPAGEQRALGFEGIGAGHEQHVASAPVFVGRRECFEAGIIQARRVVAVGTLVVRGEGRRADGIQRQPGDGIGVFEILVRVGLDAPGVFAMIFQHMLRHRRHDVQRRVPRHRLQFALDPQQRRGQPLARFIFRVVALLRQGTAAHRMVAHRIDRPGLRIRQHQHMVRLALPLHDVVLGRIGPWHGRVRRAASADFPAPDAIAAPHHAIVAGGRYLLGAERRQRHGLDFRHAGSSRDTPAPACRRHGCCRRQVPARPAAGWPWHGR
jgi:hypothetical protein